MTDHLSTPPTPAASQWCRAAKPAKRPWRLVRIAASLAALLALSLTAHAQPSPYKIDPEHFSVGFLVAHVGYQKVLGMFRKAGGSYEFDEQSGELSDLRIVIDTNSVFTNHQKRDDHLRGPDFLNSAEFPEMVFTAERARRLSEREFLIDGQLSLLGQSHPVSLSATWNKSAEAPFGGGLFGNKPYVMGVSARGSFTRSTFGMTYSVDNGSVGDEVELILEFEAVRQ